MAGPEKRFEQRIVGIIENRGGWTVKYFANRMTKSGIPDLLCCYKGKFLAIEVKSKTGKPSDLQIHHRDKIRKAEGLAIICYPDQSELLIKLLDYIEKGENFEAWKLQFDFDR